MALGVLLITSSGWAPVNCVEEVCHRARVFSVLHGPDFRIVGVAADLGEKTCHES